MLERAKSIGRLGDSPYISLKRKKFVAEVYRGILWKFEEDCVEFVVGSETFPGRRAGEVKGRKIWEMLGNFINMRNM